MNKLRGSKGSIKYLNDQEGWRARLVVKLPNGETFKRESTRHHNPMVAGAILSSYQTELKRAIAKLGA